MNERKYLYPEDIEVFLKVLSEAALCVAVVFLHKFIENEVKTSREPLMQLDEGFVLDFMKRKVSSLEIIDRVLPLSVPDYLPWEHLNPGETSQPLQQLVVQPCQPSSLPPPMPDLLPGTLRPRHRLLLLERDDAATVGAPPP